MSHPLDVTDSTFEQEVLLADKPVVVDFWATWCGPCRTIGPILAEIATEHHDRLKVVKVNIDEHQTYAAKHGVTSIPTMIVFRDGEAVDKIVGALPKRTLVSRLERHFAAAPVE